MIGRHRPVRACAFLFSSAKQLSIPATSPPATICFDIFSPPPGDSEVINHFDQLSSNETNIAPRSTQIALGASARWAATRMLTSRISV